MIKEGEVCVKAGSGITAEYCFNISSTSALAEVEKRKEQEAEDES